MAIIQSQKATLTIVFYTRDLNDNMLKMNNAHRVHRREVTTLYPEPELMAMIRNLNLF
jgi:hypothetical protein